MCQTHLYEGGNYLAAVEQRMRLYIGQLALSAILHIVQDSQDNHSHMYILVGSRYYYCIVGRWYYTAL